MSFRKFPKLCEVVKFLLCLTKHHIIETSREWSIGPRSLNYGIRWRCQFNAPAALPPMPLR